ncbi:MAG: hypothetical protein GTO45_03775 [Candidatus Aminicenantes bacterium]|nr:hypothetical protein [Candidatus Aminicenantes bacterium]NIM77847.1 hypothetical protein [Candidatus Aminicenantes bacterium]NIN17159.1 hypothetical protein [Candidatus Aminicenantes bacterium]NIN41052.1 hypothetical protein [Candidatus Aminicenantes bacterium]NIN83857.1 hypothetical protein [Candidatus Aminicenantes bacterium]
MSQLIQIVKDFLVGIGLPGLAQYAEVILLFLVGSGGLQEADGGHS